uniref:NADH-ubiquinone oxidoreductase chain 1 n=1 Tax=Cyanidium caldarium TaxID=2771 RepID=NU1M_CYACA|nr:RecName: Full=NADH-ubiquinone oxidoreductase chain 1; AltName: Full=NADH dehydrogenase subunit 1 [Cyanidium caldarium]CAA88775.1 NADH dehydrogenase subunit 1 [Cyanidium caldarium]
MESFILLFTNDKLLIFNFIIILLFIKSLSYIIPLIIAIAYLTLIERKIIGSIQKRKGPNIVGIFGLLQPIADGLKLLLKETSLPNSANIFIFIIAPILTFFLALCAWAIMPFNEINFYSNLNIGILYLLAISSLGVYGIIISGWASNSKYAFLGGLRSAAQIISYEVSIGLIIINVLLCSGTLNLKEIVLAQQNIWYIFPLFPLFLMFFISSLAETNRSPFDLPEAEAELVAGYNVEYSAMGFALFFLGEYTNIILISAVSTILFLAGWLPPFDIFLFNWIPNSIWFGFKTIIILVLFIWVRAAFPRYRYDQLIQLGWKIFLPLSLAWLMLTSGILLSYDGFPN